MQGTETTSNQDPSNPNDAISESVAEKLTVRLSGEAMRRIRALAARKGITINEFMRRAVSTEAFFLEETAVGSRIFVEDKDKGLKEVVFPS